LARTVARGISRRSVELEGIGPWPAAKCGALPDPLGSSIDSNIANAEIFPGLFRAGFCFRPFGSGPLPTLENPGQQAPFTRTQTSLPFTFAAGEPGRSHSGIDGIGMFRPSFVGGDHLLSDDGRAIDSRKARSAISAPPALAWL